MKANELRIGNFVFSKSKNIAKIDEIPLFESTYLIGYDSRFQDFASNFEPIPLTEEWLQKFGFVKYDQMGSSSFWNYSLPNNRNWNIAIFPNGIHVSFASLNWDNCPVIQYVHQLQNLYFAITGQELEIIS